MFVFIKIIMFYSYCGVKVFYTFKNKKSREPVLLLHGWGVDSQIFDGIVKSFPEKSFLCIDFPPFGKSQKIVENYSIYTYVALVMSLCEHLKIDKCDLLAHSFGGRVASILASVKCSLVRSCIFVDSAGIKPKRNLKYYYKVYKYKLLKKLGKSTLNMGSKDYQKLDENMKKTFNSIVNEDLSPYYKNVVCKSLIIWGEKDNETPMYMAKKIAKYVRNSKLEIIKNSGHFCFLSSPLTFNKLIGKFWEETQ